MLVYIISLRVYIYSYIFCNAETAVQNSFVSGSVSPFLFGSIVFIARL